MTPVRIAVVTLTVGLVAATAWGITVDQYGGSYGSWPTDWTPLLSLNDPDDGLAREHLDFVGNDTHPGAFWAWDDDYIYFRMRVDAGTVGAATYTDTIMVLVDNLTAGVTGQPDYAFMWDTNGSPSAQHGLELGIPDTVGTKWSTTKMNDLDGNSGLKIAPPDFADSGGEGYLRTTDGQASDDFGTTSLIDWAISWAYLASHTDLRKGQSWAVQFGSIDNATDHNNIRYDVAGGHAPGETGLSWSESFETPEPCTLILLGLGMAGLAGLRGRRR